LGNFDIAQLIQGIVVAVIPVLYAITLHEVAHGWAALKCGDRTAQMMGRLSLNPLKHIDPMGTIAVPLLIWVMSGGKALFGWAKPVPVNFAALRRPKRDMIIVALAGPLANIAMGVGWALLLKAVYALGLHNGLAGQFLIAMSQIGILINALLAAFNLLPIPPLDGGRVLRGLVSEPVGRYLDRIEPFGLIIMVVLLVSGLLWVFVGPLYSLVIGLIETLARL